ncbi:folate biosynthesis protein [Sulfolobus acidocaldarius SUSAZ]|nr:folate biosynthesis protein [Sulfolobus acidocaldarius SUSAZ]
MTYKISIEDLRLYTIIGINPQEKEMRQEVSIDVHYWADLREGAKSDLLPETVDYKVLKKEIISYVENSSFNLLESLAYRLSKVVLQDNRIKKVVVKVGKPGALSRAKNVSVEVRAKRKDNLAKVYISIGSNINPEDNVRRAIELLDKMIKIRKISTVYLTKSIPPDQPDYFNCVVESRINMSPKDLKYNILRKIESELGRERTKNKFLPRTIDLDLILYGNRVINEEGVTVPDPEIEGREFLAIPLIELNEDLVIPGINKSIKEIVKKFEGVDMKPLTDFTSELRSLISGSRKKDP